MQQPLVLQGNVQDDSGDVISGATITVVNADTSLPVTLFSDLSETPLSNPFTTDSQGRFEFYCEGQTVNVTAESGGFNRVWLNHFINTQGLKNDILNNSQLYSGSSSYTGVQNFQNTILAPNLVLDGKNTQSVSGTNGGDSIQVNSDILLNQFDLSSSNTGTATNRGVSEAGAEARITKRFNDDLGTAAYADLTTSAQDTTSGRAVSNTYFQPSVSYGLGTQRLAKNETGAATGANQIISGADLGNTYFTSSGAIAVFGTLAGSWKVTQGFGVNADNYQLVTRVL